MLHLFLTPSPLLVAGEVLVGISLPMFLAALIVAYGHRIRLSAGRWARTDLCTPDPETAVPSAPLIGWKRSASLLVRRGGGWNWVGVVSGLCTRPGGRRVAGYVQYYFQRACVR
jgi:hypothetical protein